MQHGGLLAMSELFRAANRDWEMRFRDIEETILAEAGGGLDLGAVLMEGRAFLMDVRLRTVIREFGPDDAGNVQELGGVIRVLGPEEVAGAPSALEGQRTLRADPAVPPGVLEQLERGNGPQVS